MPGIGSDTLPMPADTSLTNTNRRHLSVLEVAREIGVSPDHIWRLIGKGELIAMRVPGTGGRTGRVLVARAELERALLRWQSGVR